MIDWTGVRNLFYEERTAKAIDGQRCGILRDHEHSSKGGLLCITKKKKRGTQHPLIEPTHNLDCRTSSGYPCLCGTSIGGRVSESGLVWCEPARLTTVVARSKIGVI